MLTLAIIAGACLVGAAFWFGLRFGYTAGYDQGHHDVTEQIIGPVTEPGDRLRAEARGGTR